ncbi:amino acid-binding protein [Paraburkholderia sp. J12]|uniref:amino acid-binding protein n=1 Tax=Paraburkholderia sp. J12 TaxID=2805432 RepID=UPI002ABE19AF|nr:amino acid-binding protein [Paraburkholderia sp. J12]
MEFSVETLDAWRAEIGEQPSVLAEKLETLVDAGADLALVLARFDALDRAHGSVLIAPGTGTGARSAAHDAGFDLAHRLHLIRIEGPERRGLTALIVRRLADNGVNIQGFWASSVGPRFTAAIVVDTIEDLGGVLHTLSQIRQ